MFGKKFTSGYFMLRKICFFWIYSKQHVSMRMAKGQEKIRNVVCCLKKPLNNNSVKLFRKSNN